MLPSASPSPPVERQPPPPPPPSPPPPPPLAALPPPATIAHDSEHAAAPYKTLYAVLTTAANHASRCGMIIATWGRYVPPGQLIFYSDRPAAAPGLPIVAHGVQRPVSYTAAQVGHKPTLALTR